MTMSQTITQPDNTKITLTKSADYRDSYANSVQVRLSIWDFFLVFGTLEQQNPEQVRIDNFQGIYLSPQQAKALANVLNHNVAQYEQSFGPISLEGPGVQRFVVPTNGPVH
jgi:flagellar protein FlaG